MKNWVIFLLVVCFAAFSVYAVSEATTGLGIINETDALNESDNVTIGSTIVYNLQDNENPIWVFQTRQAKGCTSSPPSDGPFVQTCKASLEDVTSSEALNFAGDGKYQKTGGYFTASNGKPLQLYYVKIPKYDGRVRSFTWHLDRGNVGTSLNSNTYLWNFNSSVWEMCDSDPANKTSNCTKSGMAVRNYTDTQNRIYFMQQASNHNYYASTDFVSFTAHLRNLIVSPEPLV